MNNKNYIILLCCICALLSIVFFSLRVMQYRSFFSFEYEDDGRENQTVYNIATQFRPYQTIYQTKTIRYFNDHFTPIYYFLAIFYKIYPHLYTWYFLMCFSYVFCALIVYLLARDILQDDRLSFFMALIYLMYPPLHYAALTTIESRNFTLPLFFLSFYFLYKKKFVPYLISMLLACMCKEDIALHFIFFGLYQIFKKYPLKWWLTTLIFSFSYFLFGVYMTNTFCKVATMETSGAVFLGEYDYIDMETLKGIFTHIVSHPEQAYAWIFNWFKMRFFVMLLYPLLFMSLFSLEFYIPFIIIFLEVCLPKGFFNQNSYYVAPMIPFVIISFLFTFQKVSRKMSPTFKYVIISLISLLCVINSFTRNIIGCTASEAKPPLMHPSIYRNFDKRFSKVNNVFDPRIFQIDEDDRIAWRMIDTIPPHASVMVTGDLLPALSARAQIYEFAVNHPQAFEKEFTPENYPGYDVDFIMINRKCLIHGLGGSYAILLNQDYIEKEIMHLQNQHKFKIRDKASTYILLEKKGGGDS